MYFFFFKTSNGHHRLNSIHFKPFKGAVEASNLPEGSLYIKKKLYKTHRGFLRAAQEIINNK